MDSNANTFHFQLSLAELHWLAGAFGLTNLPLPENSLTGATRQQMQVELDKGNASLLTRGLIQRSSDFSWQVDRLPSAIIRWFSAADSLLRMEHISKSGITRRIHIFTTGEQGMSVEMDADTTNFILYETRSSLIESICKWLEIPTTSAKKSDVAYQLPQPQTFLPAAWKNPKLGESMLKTASIKAKIKDSVTWVKSLETVATISKVHLDGRDNKLISQFTVCGDKKFIWGGTSDGNNEMVSFVPMTLKDLTTIMDNSL